MPIGVAFDESGSKNVNKAAVSQVWVSSCIWETPFLIGLDIAYKSLDADKVIEIILTLLLMYLTAAQIMQILKVMNSDNASYMKRSARRLAITHLGDPAHSIDLMIKNLFYSMRLKPLLMLGRKLLMRKHCMVMRRLCEAFGLEIGLFDKPATRFGYWVHLCVFLALRGNVAIVEQILIAWLLEKDVQMAAITFVSEAEVGDRLTHSPCP